MQPASQGFQAMPGKVSLGAWAWAPLVVKVVEAGNLGANDCLSVSWAGYFPVWSCPQLGEGPTGTYQQQPVL